MAKLPEDVLPGTGVLAPLRRGIRFVHLDTDYAKWLTFENEVELRKAIAKHLKALTPDDRYLRFFGSFGDASINAYVDRIELDEGGIFIAFDEHPKNLVGFLHLGAVDQLDEYEVGISVASSYRKQGIGYELFKEAVKYATNTGAKRLYINCLYQNVAMQKMVKKLGEQFGTVNMTSDGETKTAKITLPGTQNLFGIVVGNVEKSIVLYDLAYQRQLRNFEKFMQHVNHPRSKL